MDAYKIVNVALFALLSFLACANRGGLSGGPEDKMPPEVVSFSPAHGEMFVDKQSIVEILFSEWLEDKTSRQSIYITPSIPQMAVRIEGRTVRIVPKSPLLDNTTYSITVGTGARDLRGNAIAESFSFIFSTGGVIDSGKISGVVMDFDGYKAEKGTALFAYKITENSMNLSPLTDKPMFVTESGEQGEFSFYGLAVGKYRVFGVRDINRDSRLNIGKEKLYLPLRDAVVADVGGIDTGLTIILTDTDTSTMRIISARAVGAASVSIKPSKLPVDSLLKKTQFAIHGLDVEDSFIVDHKSFFVLDSTEIIALVRNMKKGKYRLTWRIDTSGIVDSVDFSASGDTLAYKIRVRSVVQNDSLTFLWNSALDTSLLRSCFGVQKKIVKKGADTLSDTVRVPVSGKFYSASPVRSVFVPEKKWEEGVVYSWRIDKPMQVDSAISELFSVREQNNTGSISGHLIANEGKNWIVAAISRIGRKRVETAPLVREGLYAFTSLQEGAYRFVVYDDANGNKRYDKGSLTPLVFPEFVKIIDDSVFIRRRWEVENFDIKP